MSEPQTTILMAMQSMEFRKDPGVEYMEQTYDLNPDPGPDGPVFLRYPCAWSAWLHDRVRDTDYRVETALFTHPRPAVRWLVYAGQGYGAAPSIYVARRCASACGFDPFLVVRTPIRPRRLGGVVVDRAYVIPVETSL